MEQYARHDLDFKDFELKRKVGLESISGHRAEWDENESTTMAQLGEVRNGGSMNANSVLESFRNKNNKAKPSTAIKEVLQKNVQQYDPSRDPPLWFEKICELEGVTEAETMIVQSEIMHSETQMMQVWSKEARGLIVLKAEESSLRDFEVLEELQNRTNEIERQEILSNVGMSSLAGILNKTERKNVLGKNKGVSIRKEHEQLASMERTRHEIIDNYFKRSSVRNSELISTFREGPAMLKQFGGLLENTCNNLVQNNKSRLLEELHKHGVDVGRSRANDATNKLYRKVLLNSLDKSKNIYLDHGELTMVHIPSTDWGYVFATAGPWKIKRYDKSMVETLTKEALLQLDTNASSGHDALKNLARVLDAVQVGVSNLYKTATEFPRKSKQVLQDRLDSLGIHIDGPETSLLKIKQDGMIKEAVKEVILKTLARLQYHGRFYFEVHPHTVPTRSLSYYDEDIDKSSKVECSFEFTNDTFVVGLSFDTLSCAGFPGNDASSFGFCSDGSVWHNGERRSFTGDWSQAKVVGVLMDLNLGNISLFIDCEDEGAAFGVNSSTYGLEEQTRQGEIIRKESLIPAFATKPNPVQVTKDKTLAVEKTEEDTDSDDSEEWIVDDDAHCISMSVNFGGYAFSRLPPESLSCDSYLTFSQEKGKEDAIATLKVAVNHQVQVEEYRTRISFFNSMQNDRVASWSNYPPMAYRQDSSASVIQRMIRRFLGRKWRTTVMKKEDLAIRLLQRNIRIFLPLQRLQKILAVRNVQRMWRGRKARELFRTAVRFGIHPDELSRQATKLQASYRGHVSKVQMKIKQVAIQNQVTKLIESASHIQSKWRNHKRIAEKKRYGVILKFVLKIQKKWRGMISRQNLIARFGEDRVKELEQLGKGVLNSRKRKQASIHIQRIWRGHADRTYAAMRHYVFNKSARAIQRRWKVYNICKMVDSICDAGSALAVKYFLRGMKVI